MHRAKVIVFDDDQEIADYSAMMLEEAGFDVHACCDSESLRECLQKNKFDLFLSDYRIEHETLDDILHRLSADFLIPQIPIVLITAFLPNSSTLDNLKSFGLVAVLEKPFSPEEMIILCKKTLTSVS